MGSLERCEAFSQYNELIFDENFKKACTKLNQLKFNELSFKVRLLENVFAIHFLKILDLIKFEKTNIARYLSKKEKL